MKVTRSETAGLRLEIAAPPRDLAPYITAFYRTEVGIEPVEDRLPPEWANLRVGTARVYEAAIADAPRQAVPPAVISGPTSRVTYLRIADGAFWGVGLLPLGFAKFIGEPATAFADRFSDVTGLPALDPFGALIDHLLASQQTLESELGVFVAAFRRLLSRPIPQAEVLTRAHEAILSDQFTTVAGLAEAVGVSTRTLERLCLRDFGFAPRLLLRRQRFLRSLGRFMIGPTVPWTQSIDSHYHDQAHFVRDFKHFMLMRPGEYAAMPHPIARTAVRARRIALGPPMQILHRPMLDQKLAHT